MIMIIFDKRTRNPAMHYKRFLLLMLVSLLTLWLLVACGREQTSSSPSGSLVGTVDGTDAFIALVPQENNGLIAYVCDGQTISVWFRGERNGNAVDLAAATGARLQASLESDAAAGTVTLADGQTHSFTASLASGEAGLYRAEETLDGNNYVGGWIILNDGSQRGLVNRITDGTSNITDGTSNTIVGPHFNIGSSVAVPNVGNFLPNLIQPYIEQDNL
jgi:hypothetical protein